MKTMETKEYVKTLKVGDTVMTGFVYGQESLRRKLTSIAPSRDCSSGMMASADDGGSCECCGSPLGTSIRGVDASWFHRVEE
jgi:hypothetical protein